MTTGIIDYIFSHPDRRDSSMICYFFCDFASRRSLEIQTVLSSFVKQILNVFAITPELEEKLERHFGGVQRPPTMEQLFQILASSAQLPDITYFIVDGLDECSDNDKRRLLLYLKRLLGIRERIKVLVSSRNEAEISRSLELFYKVSLDTPRTCSDIEIFVADKLQTKVEEGGLILQSSSMIDEIKETLVRKFDGMYVSQFQPSIQPEVVYAKINRFLWVALQLDDICKENNDEDIRRALQSLPRGLNETYARILKRIVEYRKPDIAKKIINWVAGARRPLRLDELVEGVSFEVGDTYWQQGRSRFPASETRMLQNCENLITMTHTVDGDVLQVIHFTAFEFLLSQSSIAIGVDFHIHMREANKLIRGVCLTYLNLVDFETQVTPLPRSPMVSEIDMSPSGWIPWMMSSSIMRRTWSIAVRHLWPTYDTQPIDVREVLKLNTPTTPELPPETLEKQFRLLRYATEHWINHCSDLSPDIQDEESSWKSFANMTRNGRFPLPWDLDESCDNLPYAAQFRWSVRNGHVGLFRLTTDNIKATIGAYTKLDCGGGQTALYLSCSLGYEDIVRILLSLGVDLSAPSGDPTMLQVAAAGGHLAVVDRLLHAGANVNEPPVPPDTGRTALQAAAEEGHLDVVRRLLLAGARVNMPPAYRSGCTALQAAAAGGHLTVVEHLLHAKADVNAPAVPFGQRALQAAAEGGHLAVVDRLLLAKAEVHTSTVYRGARTALQAAAAGGHLDMVDRLLQAEADVNDPAVPLGTGRTALQAAAGEGHLPVVQRLLHARADVNASAVEISGRTALQAAAEGGHLDVVNRLLQAGADVNIHPAFRFGRTALQAAAGMGHLDMVNRLLQANANVNAPAVNISGRTALQAAAERGYLSVVDRLLEATADVNAPAACRSGRTALQAAAEGGYLHIVDRLLRAGADVNAPAVEVSGRTALQAAAERGHIDVVERLLRAGADVNAPAAEHDGLSALQAAELGEHMKVIGRLQRTAE